MAPSKSTKNRERMKERDPEKYRNYQTKQKELSKQYRESLKKELQKRKPSETTVKKKEEQLLKQRKRQAKYLAKRKQNGKEHSRKTGSKLTKKTRVTRNMCKTTKEYNREMKRKQRASMTPHKRMWQRKKDRERKKAKRAMKKCQLKTEKCEEEKQEGTANKINTGEIPIEALKKSKKGREALFIIARALVNKSKRALQRGLKIDRRTIVRKRPRRHYRSFVSEVRNFYKREDNSRVMPQKRFATKDGPGYLLQLSLRDIHLKYLGENPTKHIISYSKFCSLRPKNVRLLSSSHREYCVCTYCINVRFKMLALSKEMPPAKKKTNENNLFNILLCVKSDNDRFHKKECIDGTCKTCVNHLETLQKFYADIPSDKIMSWCKWEKQAEKKILITKCGNKATLLEEFIIDIDSPAMGVTFLLHLFNGNWQYKQYNSLKEELPEGWTLSVMDFAKNRSIFYQNEVKSAFFGQEQVTMHPIVTYYGATTGQVVCQSNIFISEDNIHDFHAVKHFTDIARDHVATSRGKEADTHVDFSDGCAAQYKSKGPFAILSQENINTNRNYFGSEHGKGPCDAETGVINRAVDRAIIGNKVIINNCKDLFNFCKENLEVNETLTKRTFFFVKNGEIDRNKPEVMCLVGSRRLHQMRNTGKPYEINVRTLSCFCDSCKKVTEEDHEDCVNKKYVTAFVHKKLKVIIKEKKKRPREKCDGEPSTKRRKTEVSDKSKPMRSVKKQGTKKQNKVCSRKQKKSGEESAHPLTDKKEIQLGKKQKKISGQEYFHKQLNDLTDCRDFSALTAKCSKIRDELSEIEVDRNISLTNFPLLADKEAIRMPYDVDDSIQTWLPVCVTADGNCLPRSASVIVFGNAEHHEEMRVRIVVQMCQDISLYTDNAYVNSGMKFPQKEAKHLINSYTMFSDEYNYGDVITPATVRRVYQKEALSVAKINTFMGIWQLFALASILRQPVTSVYPNLGTPVPRLLLNRTILPSHPKAGQSHPVVILWTSTRKDMNVENWLPNHFLPILPLTPNSQTRDYLAEETDVESSFDIEDGLLDNLTIDFSLEEADAQLRYGLGDECLDTILHSLDVESHAPEGSDTEGLHGVCDRNTPSVSHYSPTEHTSPPKDDVNLLDNSLIDSGNFGNIPQAENCERWR